MKKRKNFVLLGILLLVAVTSGVVAVTYSRYITTATGNSSATVASWIIRINNDGDVAETNTFTTDDVTWTNNNAAGNVLADHIAPGVSGQSSIVLDASDAQVDVEYSITIDTSDLVNDFYNCEQLSVTIGSGQDAVEVDFTDNSGDPITHEGNIWLTSANRSVTIPITIAWANENQYNESDTLIGATISSIDIPVSVTVSQVVSSS